MESLKVLRKRWLIILLVPCIAAITSAALSFKVIKPVYQASATVIVSKTTDTAQNLEYSAIMANQQLAKTYEAIAKSRTVLHRVAGQVDANMDVDELMKQVSVEAVKGTEVIALRVNNNDPAKAAFIANKLTEEFSIRVLEVKKVDSVSVLDRAEEPSKPIKPRKLLNIGLAFLAGLASGIGLAFLVEHFDTTVKNAEEVEKLTDLMAIGVIPKF